MEKERGSGGEKQQICDKGGEMKEEQRRRGVKRRQEVKDGDEGAKEMS